MATRVYVSTTEAEFFKNNTLRCASGIPIEGQYKIGDLVISSVQQNEVVGWVCIKGGNPGEWQSIRSAGNWLQVELEQINDEIHAIKIANVRTDTELVLLGQKINDNVKAIDNNKTSINIINNELVSIKNNIETHDTLIGVIEGELDDINGQITTAKQTLIGLSTQILTNKNNITTVTEKANKTEQAVSMINNQVGANGVASKDSVDQVITQINIIKELLGSDEDVELLDENICKEIDLLKELIGTNYENYEGQGGILQELAELKAMVGIGEEGSGSLIDEINAIKELIGDHAEGESGGILEEINNIKNMIGKDADGENPATGIQKEIDDIENEVDNIIESIENVREELLRFWVGTQKEYEALAVKEPGRLYIIVD